MFAQSLKASRPAIVCAARISIALFLVIPSGRAQTSADAGKKPATFSIERDHPQAASLDGLWRFHPGDDLRWADANFDDSQWPLLRSDKPWTRQGYPNTFGYGWYRFRIERADGSRPLALLVSDVNSGFQLYADGKLVGSAGTFRPTRNAEFGLHPTYFMLPPSDAGPRTIQIALRVWAYKPIGVWDGAGLLRPGNEGGSPALLAQTIARIRDSHALQFINEFAFGLLALIVGLTILTLYMFHPADREYLWFAILLLTQTEMAVVHLMLNLGSIPFAVWRLLDMSGEALSVIAALIFFSTVLRRRRSTVWRLAGIATALCPLTAGLIYFQVTSVGVSFAISVLCLLPAECWIIASLLRNTFRKDTFARLLLAPALLFYGADVVGNISRIAWQLSGNPRLLYEDFSLTHHPFPLSLEDVINYVFVLALLVFLVRRFSQARAEETRLSNEMEAARSVQSLLVPSTMPSTPGFAVESVYLPAHEVAGDFFQIIPHASDGSLLIVAGDVNGKGLPAGMLVAVLVGAIRSTID
ncbi:MAG: hypothetical protein WB439_11050, partial [Acidobacteriaceae bacterium]